MLVHTNEPQKLTTSSIFPPLPVWAFVRSLELYNTTGIREGLGYNLVEGEAIDFTEALMTLTDGALKTTKPFPIQGCMFTGPS